MRTVAMILIGLSVCGCVLRNGSAEPVLLPAAQTIDQIVISPPLIHEGTFAELRAAGLIEQPERIQGLIQFIAARNDRWETTWHTFPTPQYTLTFERAGETVFFLWVSRGWIGTRPAGAGENQLRKLNRADWQELSQLLGMK